MEHIARTMCKIVQFDIANKWHNNVVYYKIVFLIKRDVVWVLDKDKETKKKEKRMLSMWRAGDKAIYGENISIWLMNYWTYLCFRMIFMN